MWEPQTPLWTSSRIFFFFFPMSHIKVESLRRSVYRDHPHTQRIALPTFFLSSYLSFSVACSGYVWCSIYSLMSVNYGLPSGALSMAQISQLNMPGVNSTISIRLQYTGLLLCSIVIGRTFSLPQECLSWRPVLSMHPRTSFRVVE